VRPRIENAVIFVIMQGIPNELKPVKRVERTRIVETRRGNQADLAAGQLCLPLKTILRGNSLVCAAESAIFRQVAAIDTVASCARARTAPPCDASSTDSCSVFEAANPFRHQGQARSAP
jgi:hypothetical protein